MKLTLGFSPCPNDTFLFHALVHNLLDNEGLEFEVILDDVEALNRKALRAELALTKLSYAAFASVVDKYTLMRAGSALGYACGPMLISKKKVDLSEIANLRIAVPGFMTSANFLLSLAFPDAINKTELVFDKIEGAVLSGSVDAGLIIHENRFTYQDKGLVKLIDLGEWWEKEEKLPIPLGGICARRDLDKKVILKVESLIRQSVRHAFDHPDDSEKYVAQLAQEMDPEVRRAHIELYVNKYTEDLGQEGIRSVMRMFELGGEKGLIPKTDFDLFVH